MPSLDGNELFFGVAVKITTRDNPRDRQENTYPGLNGVEMLDMGNRGRFTTVQGILYADSPFNLGAIIESFRSYKDGLEHTLVDSEGWVWPHCVLDSFEPDERGHLDGYWGYWRRYTAVFKHTI